MKYILINVLALLTVFQTSEKLQLTDLLILTNKKWAGTLSYLDYGSAKLVQIQTELEVIASTKEKGCYTWITKYPLEPTHNSTDEIIISTDGSSIDEEMVKTRSVLKDGTLKFITEREGSDNNKKALFRITYFISKSQFFRKKEVRYLEDKNWFTRNELSLKIAK